jgi:hypothetical protein
MVDTGTLAGRSLLIFGAPLKAASRVATMIRNQSSRPELLELFQPIVWTCFLSSRSVMNSFRPVKTIYDLPGRFAIRQELDRREQDLSHRRSKRTDRPGRFIYGWIAGAGLDAARGHGKGPSPGT